MSVDSIKKTSSSNETANSSSSASSSKRTDYGSVFAGRNAEGKNNNTKVFNELDSQAKSAIATAIGNKAYVKPSDIVDKLNANGVTATVGSAKVDPKDKDATTYIEITNKDGTKSRIWDVGSDGGIGTQDIDLNGQLKDLGNDVKSGNITASSNSTSNNTTSYPVSESSNLSSSSNNNVSSENTSNNSDEESSSEYNKRYEDLRAELKKQDEYKGYNDTQLDSVIRKMLAE